MPYKRKRKGGYKKKRFMRKGKRKGRRPVTGNNNRIKYYAIGRQPATMPSVFQTKLVLTNASRKFSVSVNSAVFAFTPARLSAPIDTGGDAYRWFDQLNDIYEQSVLFGWTYEFKIINNDVETCIVCVNYEPKNNPPPTMDDATITEGAQTRNLSSALGGRSQCRIKGYVSQKKLFGQNPVSEEDFWSTGGATPDRASRMFLTILNTNTDTYNISVELQIIAYVKFFSRVQFQYPTDDAVVVGLEDMDVADSDGRCSVNLGRGRLPLPAPMLHLIK